MSSHLRRDLEQLKSDVLLMGGMVEEATELAIRAVVERRPELAADVVRGDDAIDRREIELEEECLKILALHQPVAGDLRFVVAIMKVNNDLERVGDLALNIAERAEELASFPALPDAEALHDMTQLVRTMLRGSLNSLVQLDGDAARCVCDMDAEVDENHKQRFQQMLDLMRDDPSSIERAVAQISVSRYLERIADHATNIAEDVVFMVEGEIIRHAGLSEA